MTPLTRTTLARPLAMLLGGWFSLAPAAPSPAKPVHIVLAGDSTVTDNAGWGLGFRQFLADEVVLTNTSLGGRSSMNFIEEGSWQRALALKGAGKSTWSASCGGFTRADG